MKELENLYKKGQLPKIDISDSYRALLYLYYNKNYVFYRNTSGELECKYDNLEVLYLLVKTQETMMKNTGTPLFSEYGTYPMFNKEVELDNEYYALLKQLIIADDQYSTVLNHKIVIKEKCLILGNDIYKTKYGNKYLKIKIKFKSRVKVVYCFDDFERYKDLKLGESLIEYTDEKYPKLISVKQANNMLNFLIPTDIVI